MCMFNINCFNSYYLFIVFIVLQLRICTVRTRYTHFNMFII